MRKQANRTDRKNSLWRPRGIVSNLTVPPLLPRTHTFARDHNYEYSTLDLPNLRRPQRATSPHDVSVGLDHFCLGKLSVFRKPVLGSLSSPKDCTICRPFDKQASTRVQTGLGRLSAPEHHIVKFVVFVKASRSDFLRCVIYVRSCRVCSRELGPTSNGSGTWSVSRPSAEGGSPEHVEIFYCKFSLLCNFRSPWPP